MINMSALLGAFFSMWHISLVPKPWGKRPPGEQEETEADPLLVPAPPVLQAVSLERPFWECAHEISHHIGPIGPCVRCLPPASLRFFYSVPSVILLRKKAISKGVR